MILLLPFLNAFILFICLEEGQLMNKPYMLFMERFAPYLPEYLVKILGGCVLCSATWMGIAELLIIGAFSITVVAFNAVATLILFKFMKL